MLQLRVKISPRDWHRQLLRDLYEMDASWMEVHAERIAAYAWEAAPYEWGDLQGTIGVHDIKEDGELIGYHVIAGTHDGGYVPSALGRDVFYAPYLEYENSRHVNGPYPFMGPAFDQEEQNIINTAMRQPRRTDLRQSWATVIKRI